MLEACLIFCEKHAIHFVVDEVSALSSFDPIDSSRPGLPKFTSVLSLDPIALGCSPERLHVIWSVSKDLSASGVRLVSSLAFPQAYYAPASSADSLHNLRHQ